MRRNASSATRTDRVIGTLLGVQLGGGLIEITGSYPVPHVEKDKEVAVGKDFNRQMKALHAKSSPGEQVVGKWKQIMRLDYILSALTNNSVENVFFLSVVIQVGTLLPLLRKLRLMPRAVWFMIFIHPRNA